MEKKQYIFEDTRRKNNAMQVLVFTTDQSPLPFRLQKQLEDDIVKMLKQYEHVMHTIVVE